MKKSLKVIGISLCTIAILIGGGVIWQWENLDAVMKSRSYSKEELVGQISTQKEAVDEALKEYGIENIIGFTFEEEEAIRRGELTFEEALQRIEESSKPSMGADSQEAPAEGETAEEGAGEAPEKVVEEVAPETALIKDASVQLYGLKAKYIAQLGELERSARSTYAQLAKTSSASQAAKSVMSQYSGTAISLQGQCDAEVSQLLAGLKSELQALGKETSIVETMRQSYEQEKTLKKAYYLSMVQGM